ncbi:O-antigen ligase family protein [Flavobacterium restrictum]|uniref:O-antigen ligase family protein n=1 Tax=Flavobacterium restrictum TaxID=2594428 RepID=A0A553ED22_9FLAO|nr:O-antigen ligase family protein [Flavobacterium restrictum]TRX42821.1 O-antigen ligase family protein [Flavobacterium restrictum]
MTTPIQDPTNSGNKLHFLNKEFLFLESMSLLFIALYFCIDFLPYFGCNEIIPVQYFYLSFCNIAIGIYVICNPIVFPKELLSLLSKNPILKVYAAFVVICGISIVVATNISLSIVAFSRILIGFIVFINATILLYNSVQLLYKIAFIVGFFTFLQALQGLLNLVEQSQITNVLTALSTLKGNTGGINIFSASLAIKIPFLLLGISHFQDWKKWFLSLTLFLALTGVFLTGARAALLSSVLVIVLFLFFYFRTKKTTKTIITNVIAILLPLVFSYFVTNKVFQQSKDTGRYTSIATRVNQINTQDESTNLRLIFWGYAIQMANKNPLLGIGIGNYRVESIPYEKTTASFCNVSLHTHNDFLEITSETGYINGVIYALILLLVLIQNIKKSRRSQNSKTQQIALLALLILVVYGIDSALNFPMYRPTMQLLFVLSLALTIVTIPQDESPTASLKSKKIGFLLVFVSILTLCFSYLTIRTSQLEFQLVADNINVNAKGKLSGKEVASFSPKFPNVFSSSESFDEYAAIYFLREKNIPESFRYLSKAAKINPYLGRIAFYKYVIAKHNNKLDSANVYLKQAFYRQPTNQGLYQTAIKYASSRKDTIGILKIHTTFTTYRKAPENWQKTAMALQKANFSSVSMLRFIDLGLEQYPNNPVLLKQKNELLKNQ